MKNRGLYGQDDCSYNRGGKDSAQTLMTDHMADNEIAEGDIVATMRRMAKEHNWKMIETFSAELRKNGHSLNRINSMITRAMAGIRI